MRQIYAQEWATWPRSSGVRLLVGGPACTPYSKAGKEMGSRDSHSSQAADMAVMAAYFDVDIVIIENVPQLLDHRHALALVEAAFRKQGYRLQRKH